jgi:multidrug efflux pump subunit AcrA (membrane-fusion protein)
VRSEGAIDPLSRQLFVVAQINNPYGRQDNKTPPLKIGQFIDAEIKGNLLRDVFVIPSSALGDGNSVLIVDETNHISPRKVHAVWSAGDRTVIDSGLSQGERLSLTPLRYVVNNKAIKVQIREGPSDTNEGTGKPYSKKTGSDD